MEPQPILFLISIDDLGLGTCEGQTDTGRGREREVQALGIIVWGGGEECKHYEETGRRCNRK